MATFTKEPPQADSDRLMSALIARYPGKAVSVTTVGDVVTEISIPHLGQKEFDDVLDEVEAQLVIKIKG